MSRCLGGLQLYYKSPISFSHFLAKVLVKEKHKDEAINIQYLFHQAGNNPSLFRYAKPGEIEKQVESHQKLLETYQPIINILEDQRDRNLAHLDRKHIKQPEWRENQPMLDLNRVEELYRDLIGVIAIYYRLFFDGEFNFGDWYYISQSEVKTLVDYFETFQLMEKFSTIFFSLVLIGLILLTGCQAADQQNGAAAAIRESKVEFQTVGSELPYAKGALTELSADDITAYRWLAIARFYAKDPYIGVDLTTLDPDDVMAFRWLAMARAYQKMGLLQTK